VYVTHDQREALALSDRVVVMDHGHIEQVGAPEEVYAAPASPFTARFVGDANVIAAQAQADGVVLAAGIAVARAPAGLPSGDVWVVVRPEAVRVAAAVTANDGALVGTVADVAFRGSGISYRVAVPGLAEPIKAEVPAEAEHLRVGEQVACHWSGEAVRVLPRVAEEPVAQSDVPPPAVG
jgi:ABC-type Fe3+/spermidine/putrescine transport system ATPase subunit